MASAPIACIECGIGHYHALFPGTDYGTCLSCGHMVHLQVDVAQHLGTGEALRVGDRGFLEVTS